MSATAIPKKRRVATRPTCAEVSLSRLRGNFRAIRQHAGTAVTVCAVVKADGYGHGAVECALALQKEGARWLGVTSLDEAIPLREAGIETRILLMTGFWPGEESEIIRLQLTPTVWEAAQINSLQKAAVMLDVRGFPVHLKVDTGMGRLGVALQELPDLCEVLKSSSHLALEGVSTHLASSEVLDAASVRQQLDEFEKAKEILREHGLEPKMIHAANTAAMISRT